MRILTRYILSEVVSHAAIGIAVFTFVIFTRDLGHILDLVVRNSAPLPSVAEIFIFTLPVAFTYTIPMGVLVGILIGLSRLAADSEITAMRASGIGVWTFLRVVSIFAIAAWAVALFNAVYLAPASQAALGRLEDRLKTSQASFEVQPRVFYEGFPKLVLYVQDVKTARGAAIWKGVFIADISTPATPRITLARQGILVSEGPQTLHLHLTDGATHETDAASSDHYQISTFDQTDIPIPVPQTDSKDQEPVPLAATAQHVTAGPGSHGQKVHRALVLHRDSTRRFRLARVLSGAGPGWNSSGSVVEEGRQVGGIRPHHCAGVCVLLGHPDRSVAGPPGKSAAGVRRVAGQYCFLSGWSVSVVEGRAPARF